MIRRFLAGLALIALTLAYGLPAQAQTQMPTQTLRAGGVVVMTADQPVASAVVSNDLAIRIEPRGPRTIVVFGLAEGTAELILLDDQGLVVQQALIEVYADVTSIESLIRQVAPEARISIARSGDTVVLSGTASDSSEVSMIVELVTGALPGSSIVNLIVSEVDDQFAVSVKVLEVRRSRVEEIGLRWEAQNRYNQGVASIGSGIANAVGQSVVSGLFGTARFTVDRLALNAFIDFLRSDGSAVLLAEPVILASNGAPARFLAGGELPIPVPFLNAAGGTSTLGYTFKPYGVTLAFTGTILEGDRVRLELAPEVSAVDRSQAVEFAGTRVPAITTRTVETTVVLKFGESVAIAGLRSTDSSRNQRRLPFSTPFGIGDILAGNRADADNDMELVLIVTPVRAGDAPAQIPALTEPVLPGTD